MEDNNNLNFVSTPNNNGIDPKKRRASKACIYCNRSHMSCEDARPCKRCIDRGIGHLCRDSENRKRRGRKGTYLWADLQPMPGSTMNNTPNLTPIVSPPVPVLKPMPIISSSTNTTSTTSAPELDMDINTLGPDLKGLFLELFLSTNNEETNHLLGITNGEIPSKSSDDEETDKMFSKWISVVQSRAPDELDDALQLIQVVKERTNEYIKKNFKLDQIHLENMKGLNYVKADIANLVKKYSEIMEKLTVPTIMWDRGGCIYFVNSAYKRVTGFPLSLPTERSELVMYTFVLGPVTFKDLFKSQLALLQNYPENVEFNSMIFPASVRLHTQPGEKYVDGTMSVNYKRDFLGFPYFYIGSFLPSQVQMMHLQSPIL